MKLVIAEKPMLARDIARAVCGVQVSEKSQLPISGNGYTVIACSGHLLELVEPDAVNPAWADRYDLDLLPISIPDWPKEPAVVRDRETGEVIDSKEPLIDKIAALLPQADLVIHAGDPDDEGQLIVDEVLDYLGYIGEVLRVYVNDTSLGAANLDGTRFEVKSLNENPVICGGVTFQKGEVITELTIKNGEASTAADLLPFGRYTIQEVAVGDGYLLTDGKAHEFDISKDGQIVNGVEGVVKNQVKRGDLEFVKVSEADMSRLAGVPFRITSETTGESHILVTDENGYASTSAEWNKHTHKTNANDTAAEEDALPWGRQGLRPRRHRR